MKASRAIFPLVMGCVVFCSAALWADAPGDPTSVRALELFREYGHYTDLPDFPKGHPYWSDLEWYKEQGGRVRPALMYLLSTEYSGDYGKMADTVNALSKVPGNSKGFLEFVRGSLTTLPETRTSEISRFVSACLWALGAVGERSDLELMKPYASDASPTVRSSAKMQMDRLEKRLSDSIRDEQENPGAVPSRLAGAEKIVKKDGLESSGENPDSGWAKRLWLVFGCTIAAMLILLVRRVAVRSQ